MAHILGFDPGGLFQAVCSPGEVWAEQDITELRVWLRRSRGVTLCAGRDNVLMAVFQGMSADVSSRP
jgi:hypothetical protein